jgi:transcriptional regulator with XRE-family HTH domain
MTLELLKKQALRNPAVRAEYEALEAEFRLIDQLLTMRTAAGLTQQQVAEKMNTQKTNISRLERGNTNPRWSTLESYAHACGFDLVLHMRPNSATTLPQNSKNEL